MRKTKIQVPVGGVVRRARTPLAVTAVAALAVLGMAPAAHADPGDEINMPDDALRACVNIELSQNPTDPITEAQAASLTGLDCQGEQLLTSLARNT